MSKKLKVISFEDQIEKMSELHGIPTQDSLNVMSGLIKVIESVITDEVKAGTEEFEIQTPLGFIGFTKVEASERISVSDGTKFIAPEHYEGNFAFPFKFVNLANAEVDFSACPSLSDIQNSKVKLKAA